jgi:hypothetical protein
VRIDPKPLATAVCGIADGEVLDIFAIDNEAETETYKVRVHYEDVISNERVEQTRLARAEAAYDG